MRGGGGAWGLGMNRPRRPGNDPSNEPSGIGNFNGWLARQKAGPLSGLGEGCADPLRRDKFCRANATLLKLGASKILEGHR